MEVEVLPKNSRFNWFTMFWQGFTHMTKYGKTLWALVILKLIIMFFILKPFFFPKYLDDKFDSDSDKAKYVSTELVERRAIE